MLSIMMARQNDYQHGQNNHVHSHQRDDIPTISRMRDPPVVATSSKPTTTMRARRRGSASSASVASTKTTNTVASSASSVASTRSSKSSSSKSSKSSKKSSRGRSRTRRTSSPATTAKPLVSGVVATPSKDDAITLTSVAAGAIPQKEVMFRTAQIREYERVIDSSMYMGLSLGWAFTEYPPEDILKRPGSSSPREGGGEKGHDVIDHDEDNEDYIPTSTTIRIPTKERRKRKHNKEVYATTGAIKIKKKKPQERFAIFLDYGYSRKDLKQAAIDASTNRNGGTTRNDIFSAFESTKMMFVPMMMMPVVPYLQQQPQETPLSSGGQEEKKDEEEHQYHQTRETLGPRSPRQDAQQPTSSSSVKSPRHTNHRERYAHDKENDYGSSSSSSTDDYRKSPRFRWRY